MTADRDVPTDRTPPSPSLLAAGDWLPAPRPELLARVLEGLRDLPAERTPTPRADADGAADPRLPLPRRRS